MTTVIVTHEVKNYSDWKKVYDEDEENRSKSGMKITGLYQSVDNPNMVTVVGEAPSAEAVNQFMSNPELRATMERGGVLGMPDVKVLSKV
jgi:hypothetical protein